MKHLFLVTLSLALSFSLFAQQNDVVGKNIDKSINPGADFFKYANGNVYIGNLKDNKPHG